MESLLPSVVPRGVVWPSSPGARGPAATKVAWRAGATTSDGKGNRVVRYVKEKDRMEGVEEGAEWTMVTWCRFWESSLYLLPWGSWSAGVMARHPCC